jgi:hypothetical protein
MRTVYLLWLAVKEVSMVRCTGESMGWESAVGERDDYCSEFMR